MSSQLTTPPKGFRDILPEQARARDWLRSSLQRVYERHAYEPIETPTLERAETLMGKYGEEADTLLYRFLDNGGRAVGLRYDQTVPTARFMAANAGTLAMPFRRYQMQPVFRAEKPQKGRYREFLQSDADIFGAIEGAADAETLAVFWHCYAELGFTPSTLTLILNHRSSLRKLVADAKISDSQSSKVLQILDKLDKKSAQEVQEELQSSLKLEQETIARLFTLLEHAQMPQELQEIVQIAIKLGVPKEAIQFSPTLVRGLDYYTGMIFESKLSSGGSSLGGGGRYDNLIQQLGGPAIPAVGFGIGFDRTLEAAVERQLVPTTTLGSRVLVTVFDATLLLTSAEVVTTLRASDIAAQLYPVPNKDLSKQLRYADASGMTVAVVIGPDEKQANQVTLKYLETGIQKTIALDQLTTELATLSR